MAMLSEPGSGLVADYLQFLPYLILVCLVVLPLIYERPYHVKFFTYYAAVSAFGLVSIPFFACSNPKSVKNSLNASYFLKHITKVLGVEWELRGAEHLAEDRGCLIVANHQSTLDILGMFNIWDVLGKCAAVAKKELFYVWPFGLSAWLGGVVFIDRSSPAKSYATLAQTAQLTQREKTKIWFFPEGTRNWNVNKTRELLPFKRGAFKVALSCQVPVVPVVYSPYYFINPHTHYFGRGKVIMEALPAITTEGLKEEDLDDLIHRTRQLMSEKYEQLFNEITSGLPPNHPGFD